MKTSYMKRSLMLLGAAACIASASAEGTFVDVTNKYLKEPCYLPGWQGVITAVDQGVGEVWNGAFRLYQIINDVPAGEYTLTANALYRCGNNDYTKATMPGNADLHKAFLFLGDNKEAIVGLYDNNETRPAEGEDYDAVKHAPNWLGEANAAFEAGKYVNTVKYNHPGGDLILGIVNNGCYDDEWCAFDNFKLVGPEGEVAIENGDFSTGIDSKRAWDNVSTENKEKTPDMQKDGAGGGDYRKCGGSPYKYGQLVDLPEGTYRFSMLTFHRYGSTLNPDGTYYNHKSGEVTEAYGRVNRTPKDWFDAKDYDDQDTYDHAYLFMSKNEECPKDLNWSEDLGDLTEETDARTRIKDCWELCNGDYSIMPDNNVYGNGAEAVRLYESENKNIWWHDSGNEREAAAAFVHDADRYRQYVEFTLEEPAKVWVGMGKNSNTGDGYWQAWADQKLEMLINPAGVASAIATEDAAPVYYNLQGVRVANPSNGIYIVKTGNKVAKQVIK